MKHRLSRRGLTLALALAAAGPARADDQSVAPTVSVEPVLAAEETIIGQPFAYPGDIPAKVTAVIVSLDPGAETGWHRHDVPLFGYMLEGELTVDYGADGERRYRAGDGLMEAFGTRHNGRNTGAGVARILAVFMGAAGAANTVPMD